MKLALVEVQGSLSACMGPLLDTNMVIHERSLYK